MVEITKHGHVNCQVVQHFTSDLTAKTGSWGKQCSRKFLDESSGQVIVILEDTKSILQVQSFFKIWLFLIEHVSILYAFYIVFTPGLQDAQTRILDLRQAEKRQKCTAYRPRDRWVDGSGLAIVVSNENRYLGCYRVYAGWNPTQLYGDNNRPL